MLQLDQNTKLKFTFSGIIYLVIAIIGGYSIGYMPSLIVDEFSPSQTLNNLQNHLDILRWGMLGDIIVIVLELVLTALLFDLFKTYSSLGMRIATYARLAMSIIMTFNLINYLVPAFLITNPTNIQSFATDQLESIVFIYFRMHKYGELSWQLFFSIHVLVMSFVIRKSQIAPKYLDLVMLVGGLGYAGDSIFRLLLPTFSTLITISSILLVFAVIAELWFAFWLTHKGIKS